uniref:Major facilitator superfamily (MFS) profile domain-containing protein n=2 Tax=Amphimedon queenslandica TaxID=400682 RepID=A0A1X7TWA7_AMPQE
MYDWTQANTPQGPPKEREGRKLPMKTDELLVLYLLTTSLVDKIQFITLALQANLSKVINRVKDMDGFRRTMNLSLVKDEQSNGSLNCGGTDTNENALLGLVVSLFSIGCFIGALVSGALSDPIGRKLSIIVGGVVFFIGGALQASSFNLWMVLVGRMVAGIGVGILSMIVPVYNAELAPKTLRGRLVSLNQLFITAGIMVIIIN